MERISKRVISGSFWVFLIRASRRVVDIVRTILLAMFLMPKDFGIMGIAILTLQVLEEFSKTEFKSALVRKGDASGYFDVAWTYSLLRGLLLFLIALLAAPAISGFFKCAESVSVIRVIGFSFVLQGMMNISTVMLQKDLDFRKIYILETSGLAVEFVVSVASVFIFKNVWALVLGRLSGDIARLITGYILKPYRPALRFKLSKLIDLYVFSKWASRSNALVYIASQGDTVFVGRLLGAAYLGIYKLASTIANLPTAEISHIVSEVVFPAYSKIHEDLERLKGAFKKTFHLTVVVSVSLSTIIFVFISDIVRIFLHDQWLPIINPVRLLVLAGCIRSIQSVTGSIFYALGKPKLDTIAQVLRVVILLLIIFPLTSIYKINGAPIAVLVSAVFSCLLSYIYLKNVLSLRLANLFSALIAPVSAAMLFILLAYALKVCFGPMNPFNFVLSLILCCMVYALSIVIIEKFWTTYNTLDSIMQIFKG